MRTAFQKYLSDTATSVNLAITGTIMSTIITETCLSTKSKQIGLKARAFFRRDFRLT